MARTDDLLGSTATLGADGLEVTRRIYIDGLRGGRSGFFGRAIRRLGIPLGSPHPTEAGLVATQMQVDPFDSDSAWVNVLYRIPRADLGETPPGGTDAGGGEGTIRVGGSQTQIRKTTDITGKTMVVTHPKEIEKKDVLGAVTTVTEDVDVTVEADVPVPNVVLQIERVERGEPGPKARQFVGKVNSNRVGTDPPRTWLCTRIDGTSTDGGFLYRVTYEFQFQAETWDFEAVWRDPETGEIPTDLVDGRGRRRFRVIPEANFALLRLGFLGPR